MYTEFRHGFTEALVRCLAAGSWQVATLDLRLDEVRPDEPEWLRLVCPSPHRLTLVWHGSRGVLLLDELHVPLAAEIAWTLRRLDDLETVVRARLGREYRDSRLLGSAIALYADRDFDMVPDEPRLQTVEDERRPDAVLDPLADRLFDEAAAPDDVAALVESIRQLGRWQSRDDLGRDLAATTSYQLAS